MDGKLMGKCQSPKNISVKKVFFGEINTCFQRIIVLNNRDFNIDKKNNRDDHLIHNRAALTHHTLCDT